MPRTVRRVDVVGEQSFSISIKGLNVNTILNVYFNNSKVPLSNLQMKNGARGSDIVTNSRGETDFIFYLTESISNLNNNPEATFIDYLARDANAKSLVVVDQASINSSSLPENFKTASRCYAETIVYKAFQVTFTDVKDWGHVTETGGSYVKTYG